MLGESRLLNIKKVNSLAQMNYFIKIFYPLTVLDQFENCHFTYHFNNLLTQVKLQVYH